MATQLIPIFTGTLNNDSVQLINARELHTFLDSRQDFSTWIKNRIDEYGFIEGQDFLTILLKSRGRPSKQYHITLDMAKELSMVERNEKGRQARRYFIDCEKRLHQSQPQKTYGMTQLSEHDFKLFERMYKEQLGLVLVPRETIEQLVSLRTVLNNAPIAVWQHHLAG